jgi:hypothetical protein
MNPDFSLLRQQLHQWEQRRRVQLAFVWLPRVAVGGMLLALLPVALARWRPLLAARELALLAATLVLLSMLLTLLFIILHRQTLWEQARFADRQFRLQERATTAVEIYDGRLTTSATLAQQQLADTLAAARQVNTIHQLPLRLNRQEWLVLLLALLSLSLALFLPNPQEAILQEQRALAEAIAEQAAALETLQEEIAANQALTPEQQAALQAPVEQALQELQGNGLSREEAMAVLSAAEAELRDLQVDFNQEELRESLSAAGQPLAENEAAATLGEALQSGQLGLAGAAAAQLADDLATLDLDQQQALAQDLAETAAGLQNLDSELAGALNEAAEALAAGETAAAQQALREAGGILQERQQELAAAAQAGSAAQQLAEGRGEVAQAGEGEPAAGEQGSGGTEETGESGSAETGSGEAGQAGEGGATPLNGEGPTGAGEAEGGDSSGANVFIPDPADLSGIEGTDIELPAECLANPETCGPLLEDRPAAFGEEGSVVPYEQVFGDYRDAANEALAGDYIPLSLKGLVRDYFSSLEP